MTLVSKRDHTKALVRHIHYRMPVLYMCTLTPQRMLQKVAIGAARSADISPDGEMVAVGLKNGGIAILAMSTFKVLGQRRDRGSSIDVVR